MVKVFISWSGEVSRQVALVLHDWLPHVIQAIKPFISADMTKGTRWSNVLTQELNDTDFGIVCVTSGNYKKPWLNFEAGALSKSITQGQVSPFLFDVEPAKVEGPLSQFQFTKYEKNDIYNLLISMCKRLNPEDQLDAKLLREEFDQWWGTLDNKLKAIKDEDTLDDITGYNWLYPPEWITKIEANAKFSSIWIITHEHLYQHSIDKAVKDTVKSNIKNHVEYRYIIPDSVLKESDDQYHNDLRDVFPELNTTFIHIPEHEFTMRAPTDFVIIDPNDANRRKVFYKLPIKSAQGFWALVDDDSVASKFYERFKEMV